MPENDNSKPLEDDSGQKTTSHVEGIGPSPRPALERDYSRAGGRLSGFLAQSSVLSTYYLPSDSEAAKRNPEPLNLPGRCHKVGNVIIVDDPPGFEGFTKIPG